MTIPVRLEGPDHLGNIRDPHVHKRGPHNGLLTFAQPFIDHNATFRPFLNPTNGAAMNKNVGFTGDPTIIHAGVNSGAALTGTTTGTTANHLIDSSETFANIAVGFSVKNTTSGNEYAIVTAVAANDLTLDTDIMITGENYEINPIWVGTAVVGTWNFADGGKITITSANQGDEASFENDVGQRWDVANFTTLTGKIDLDTYDSINNSILISFDLDGTQVGDTLDLNDFIATGDFAEQTFLIPKGDFNFGTTIINGMTLFMVRLGGAKPTVKFDAIQWEEAGSTLEYTSQPAPLEKYHVDALRFTIVDADSNIVTVAGATENATLPGLSYNKILAVTKLTNGIVFQRTQKDEINLSANIKQLADFLSLGFNITNAVSDGTNTMITLEVAFQRPFILDGATGDKMTFTVADDLSGLLELVATARGTLEV